MHQSCTNMGVRGRVSHSRMNKAEAGSSLSFRYFWVLNNSIKARLSILPYLVVKESIAPVCNDARRKVSIVVLLMTSFLSFEMKVLASGFVPIGIFAHIVRSPSPEYS